MAFQLHKSYFNAGMYSPNMHTMSELLDIRGTEQADQEAYIFRAIGQPRQAITFGELKSRTASLALGMIKRGLKKGDCVGLICPSIVEYVVCEYALARTGAILMRFHASMRSGNDIKYMLKKSNCRWLLAHPGTHALDNYHLLESVIPNLGQHDPSKPLKTEEFPDLETVFMISSDSFKGTIPWTTFLEGIQEGDMALLQRRQDTIDNDDIQGCYSTSGSSGLPKLVAERYSFSLNYFRTLLIQNGVNETDRYIHDRPLPYAGGNSGPVLGIGFTMVCCTADAKQAEGRDFFFKLIEEESCTVLFTFQYLLRELVRKVDSGELDTSKIRLGITGGEVIQRALLEQVMRCLPCMCIGYGSTEVGNGLGGILTDSFENKLTYTGKCFEGEFKVIDDEGNIVPINTAGELCIRNHFSFVKYWGDEDKTKQQLCALGWYKTDDMATMNEDGYVTILGRKHEVISRAAIKIFPLSIERELLKHPLVAEVVAIGVPDELLFAAICLCVVPKPGASLTAETIEKFCRDIFTVGDIGEGLMPDYILLFDKFPTGSTDKTDRKKTKAEAIARLAARQAAAK